MAKHPKRPRDPNQLGKSIIDIATGNAPPDLQAVPAPVVRGRAGGLKGGKNRAEAMSPAKRREIAKKGATARWGKRKKNK